MQSGARYRQQDSGQTLAEGLEEYYTLNAGVVTRPRELPPESMALFRSHDMCHVIFGLGTSLEDEAVADTRTLLSSDVGMRRYAEYLTQDKQAKAIFARAGYLTVFGATLRAMPRILRAAWECRRTHKRWPWTPPQSHLARPLRELRREYGIRVV